MGRIRRTALWALAYLMIGALTKAITYLLTGFAQFPDDWEDPRSVEILLGDVVGFVVYRSGIALLVGAFLSWCLSVPRARQFVVLVVVVPAVCELVFLRHFVSVWVTLGTDGLVLASAYLATPLVSGMVLATAALRGRGNQLST